jgi:spore coat protein U-like protein
MATLSYPGGTGITALSKSDLQTNDATLLCTGVSGGAQEVDFSVLKEAAMGEPGEIGGDTPATALNVDGEVYHTGGPFRINENGEDYDTTIFGQAAILAYFDAGNVRAGIKTDTPLSDFHVNGDTLLDGAVVINDGGADVDCRIEGTGNQNLLYTDAGNNRIGIKTATPDTDVELYGDVDNILELRVRNVNAGSSARARISVGDDTSGGRALMQWNNGRETFQCGAVGSRPFELVQNGDVVIFIDRVTQYVGVGNNSWETGVTAPSKQLDVAGEALFQNNVTIGVGAVGVDYTLTFNGDGSDGTITWLESTGVFDFGLIAQAGQFQADDYYNAGGTTSIYYTAGGSGAWNSDVDFILNGTNLNLAESGTGEGALLYNDSTLASIARVKLYPATGTNVGALLDLVPKGTGALIGKSGITLFGTDAVADTVNIEALSIKATGTEYSLIADKSGTGASRPIRIAASSFSANDIYISTSGKIGFGTATSLTAQINVNGDIKQTVHTDNVSNPPTDAELDSVFGTPATVGAGFTVYINDNGAGNNFYQCVSDGTNWWGFTATKLV